ncbi:MAG: AI-2E family transporter, partial [Acinetobacter junii]
GYILQPFLLGDKIGLSPVAVVFAVLAGAQLGGFLGMLIALPVAAVIVVLLKHARNNYERSRLYGLPSEFVLEVNNDQPVHFETQQLDIDLEGEKTQDTDTSNKTHPD